MFGIGLSHILLLAVIGLIFIGPEELPQVLRAIAKVLGQLKRATDEITTAFHSTTNHGRDYIKEEQRLMSQSLHGEPVKPAGEPTQSATPKEVSQPETSTEKK